MALRVLLADESSTIKRVMQLALQDFGVDVKAVPVGLDVLAVTKTFKPDIIFADVLLTKRNGYEVCLELKSDSETQHLPVVLMWSGFMEVDESKVSHSKADARLEKPFDAETLRKLVQDLVPKTQENPVSSYLQFPKMPEFTEEQAAKAPPVAKAPAAKPAGKIPAQAPVDFDKFDPGASDEESIFGIPEETTNSTMIATEVLDESRHEDFTTASEPEESKDFLVAHDEEFASVPLKSSQEKDQHEEDGWTQQDLKKFKIQLPEVSADEDFASKFVIPQDELEKVHMESEGEFEELHFGDEPAEEPAPVRAQSSPSINVSLNSPPTPTTGRISTKPSPPRAAGTTESANIDMIERVIREEAREVIESICWKVIPEIAERIVREEINKILRDVDKSL